MANNGKNENQIACRSCQNCLTAYVNMTDVTNTEVKTFLFDLF